MAETEKDVYALDATQAIDSYQALVAANEKYRQKLTEQVQGSEMVIKSLADVRTGMERFQQQLEVGAKAVKDNEAQNKKLKESVSDLSERLQEGKRAAQENIEVKEKLSRRVMDLALAYISYQAVVGTVTRVMKHGVSEMLEYEEAHDKLAGAARHLGYNTEVLLPLLEDQANAIEKTKFISAETAMETQSLFLRFGAAPAAVMKATDAITSYAKATGTDAASATSLLTRALEGGRDEILKLGVAFTSTGDSTKDLLNISEQLQKRWGETKDSALTISETSKQLGLLYDDIAEGAARWAMELLKSSGALDLITERMKSLDEHFNGNVAKQIAAAEKEGERIRARLKLHQQMLDAETEMQRLEAEGRRETDAFRFALGRYHDATVRELKYEAEVKAEQAAADLKRSEEAGRIELARQKHLNEEKAKENSAAGEKRFKEVIDGLVRQGDEEKRQAEELRKEEYEEYAEHTAQLIYLDEKWAEGKIAAARRAMEEGHRATGGQGARIDPLGTDLSPSFEAIEAQEKEHYERRKAIVADWNSFVRASTSNVASAVLDSVGSMLTTNRRYTAALREEEIKRRLSIAAETGAIRHRADVEKEMANETKASILKQTAEILMGIAKQAAMKAAFNVAEGIAALATPFTAPLAPGYFAAAAKYGAVAALAGAGAYGISQARGMTSQERGSVEAVGRGSARGGGDGSVTSLSDGRASSPTGAGSDEPRQTVNVYYMGIAGVSEAEQAREMQRILDGYADRKTGSGGF